MHDRAERESRSFALLQGGESVKKKEKGVVKGETAAGLQAHTTTFPVRIVTYADGSLSGCPSEH